jgi:UDP-N-acetylmuramoyl-tripeptide--D-alanyl-D-alanine ligase
VELGMNHPGEIAALAAMAQPTVALVNNAQREHLEFMQTVQAVAEENGEVLKALPTDGVAVFPADDAYTPVWKALASTSQSAQFSLKDQGTGSLLGCRYATWEGDAWRIHASGLGVDLHYRLAIAGLHNVQNSLAAAACALSAGVPPAAVQEGLCAFVPVMGRSRAIALSIEGHACTLVDDTYNANPDSVRAAIDVLASLPAPRLLVLGDMGEVGHQGAQFHTEAGLYARACGIEQMLTLGELARGAADAFGSRHFADMDALVAATLQALPRAGSVLVKGSRFMRMERVVEAAVAAFAQQEKSACC